MKKLFPLLIISIVFSFAFLFIGSCEDNKQITSPNQQSLQSIDQQLDELERGVNELTKSVVDGTKGTKELCCNNSFPGFNYGGTTTGLNCPPSGEEYIPKLDCAKLWAKYQHTPNGQLGNKGCDKPIPFMVPTITGLTKFQQGNNPYFTWNFMYCHYYRVERKIGSGGWSLISEKENCNSYCISEANQFTDLTINLNTITQNISYRVRGNIFNSFSSGGSIITYTPPAVTVNISGPTHLTTVETGTFVANTSGGVPSTFTYSWSKYQYCNDRSQSSDSKKDDGTRGVPCGYWRSIGSTSSTVYVSESLPSFNLKCVVTDINGSATDYHYVTVSLP